MELHTASAVISFAKELEAQTAAFYEALAKRFEKDSELFLAFAKENRKFVTQIERAYYGVISDAIEGCFAFNLQTEPYELETALPEQINYSDAVNKALNLEEKIIDFYQVAAEQSKHLMADVPRSFILVAKKRNERIPKIKALLEK